MDKILAAGAVLHRRDTGEIALIHRDRYDDWSLPKGKVEPGESMPAAAVREVGEETGLRARLGALLGDIHYEVDGTPKLVRYWAAEALDETVPKDDEVDELRWYAPARAMELLTYAHDARIVERFAAIGPPDSLLLLVRHAKAGRREEWEGDDDLRPLSGKGRHQAERLTRMLPLFVPDRVATAPPVRCRDTVVPWAQAAGLPIGEEPLLGENGYWEDPAKGLTRVHELTALPGVTVVCSQGGVIPDVVEHLSGAADPASKKGSTWVLGFTDGKLMSADYYEQPF